MKRVVFWVGCLVLMACCFTASGAARDRPWGSMVVSGVLDINPDGSVRDYTVNRPEKLPSVVLDVLKQTVPGWRFEVDMRRPAIARVRMNVRVVAKPVDRTKFSISVEGVDFADDSRNAAEDLTERDMTPPVYPRDAIDIRTAATVYVLVRVGRDGHVLDAAAEQVNFTMACPKYARAGLERIFIASSVKAARRWTFAIPTKGPLADSPYWNARVPVVYSLAEYGERVKEPAYGAWQPYLPGRRLAIPWETDPSLLATAPDAAPDGKATLLDGKPRLVMQ